MGKTYKDSKGFNPSSKPKNKKSQKNNRLKIKEYGEDSKTGSEGTD